MNAPNLASRNHFPRASSTQPRLFQSELVCANAASAKPAKTSDSRIGFRRRKYFFMDVGERLAEIIQASQHFLCTRLRASQEVELEVIVAETRVRPLEHSG